MKTVEAIRAGFSRWLNIVAQALLLLLTRFRKERTVTIVERDQDYFALRSTDLGKNAYSDDPQLHLDAGHMAEVFPQIQASLRDTQVELLVRSDRFIFKPLELPARAAEFLDGVVRAQIDRLTPWSADQAAFGFSAPTDAGSGRIVVTVAATAKSILAPIVKALSGLGARSVIVRTIAPNESDNNAAITVMEENVAHVLDAQLVRRILFVTLTVSWLIAALAMIATTIIGSNLQSRQDELARRIAKERAAALTARNNPGDPKTLAERALLRRKNESPSDVIALEILSQILPDDTYVTEMHIESNKVRLTGVTHDAPQLIRLIERTRHFSQATFYAPITHSSSNPGDHFSIEARMEPNFSLTP